MNTGAMAATLPRSRLQLREDSLSAEPSLRRPRSQRSSSTTFFKKVLWSAHVLQPNYRLSKGRPCGNTATNLSTDFPHPFTI